MRERTVIICNYYFFYILHVQHPPVSVSGGGIHSVHTSIYSFVWSLVYELNASFKFIFFSVMFMVIHDYYYYYYYK